MYIPKYFAEPTAGLALNLMKEYGFATLITSGEPELAVSHLPLVVDERQTGIQLIGHMARANPHHRAFVAQPRVLVIFNGPHAYVTPTWYAPDPSNVPTWNYAVVHVHGEILALSDQREAFDQMRRLVRQYDPQLVLDLTDADRDSLLAEIVCFSIDVQRVEAKFKLSQNRSIEDQEAVARNFLAGDSDLQRQTGSLMHRVQQTANRGEIRR